VLQRESRASYSFLLLSAILANQVSKLLILLQKNNQANDIEKACEFSNIDERPGQGSLFENCSWFYFFVELKIMKSKILQNAH
jgi:hypothetical protein